MNNDISCGMSFKAVCFDFRSTNVGSSVIEIRSTTGFDVITRHYNFWCPHCTSSSIEYLHNNLETDFLLNS